MLFRSLKEKIPAKGTIVLVDFRLPSDKKRLWVFKDGIAKGYGESKLLDDCTKYPECPAVSSGDCDCHQRNRRTEFRIVGELEGIIKYDE